MAKIKIRPLSDRVLVKRLDEAEEQSVGGIIIPDTAKEKPQEAEVVAIGPGRLEDGNRVAPEVSEGDKVLIGKYSGTEVKVDGDDYLIMREDDILATLDELRHVQLAAPRVIGRVERELAHRGEGSVDSV